MALLSKFLEDFGNRTGIPLIGITRVVYSAAILGYVANVVIPNIMTLNQSHVLSFVYMWVRGFTIKTNV